MEVTLRILSLAVYLIAGTWLAYRWVFSTRGDGSVKCSRSNKILFILVAWIGVFALGAIQTQISVAYFNPADFQEDRGLTAEAANDVVAINVLALFFGWILALVCLGIAMLIRSRHP